MSYKQILLTCVVLFIAVQITLVTAYAQVARSTSSQAPVPTPVEYQLAYPGLLPDSPLYFLKVIRDDLTAFFISKPLTKASFDLLQSDKNVEASYLLVTREQGKGALAFETFSRSQDYFADAIKQVASAKKQGYSILDISKKLIVANEKHVQILEAVGRQTHQQNSGTYKAELARETALAKSAKAL
jgi:hypothetical protein